MTAIDQRKVDAGEPQHRECLLGSLDNELDFLQRDSLLIAVCMDLFNLLRVRSYAGVACTLHYKQHGTHA